MFEEQASAQCLELTAVWQYGSQRTSVESLVVGKAGSQKHPTCGEINGLDKLPRLSNGFKVITVSRYVICWYCLSLPEENH